MGVVHQTVEDGVGDDGFADDSASTESLLPLRRRALRSGRLTSKTETPTGSGTVPLDTQSFRGEGLSKHSPFSGMPYIMSGGMPDAAPLFSGISVMTASVVRTMAAIDAAFWSADRVTLAGSTIPDLNMSVY